MIIPMLAGKYGRSSASHANRVDYIGEVVIILLFNIIVVRRFRPGCDKLLRQEKSFLSVN